MMQMRNAFRNWPRVQCLASVLAILALVAGCAGPAIDPQRDNEALEIPGFLTSPAMALMTNTDGFTARVEVQTPSSLGTKTQTGRIFGRGSRLLFLPDYRQSAFSKQRAAEKTSFVWDVAESKGYVFNEALQGYAPYSISARVTSLKVTDVESVFNEFDGHRCRRGEASIGISEGPEALFTIWRATDLKALPLQIKAANGQCVINFSKISFERIGASLFNPPDGFTKHASPEMMQGTLLERQISAKKKRYESGDSDIENTPDQPHKTPR